LRAIPPEIADAGDEWSSKRGEPFQLRLKRRVAKSPPSRVELIAPWRLEITLRPRPSGSRRRLVRVAVAAISGFDFPIGEFEKLD
jgi:hypothetical protein